MKTTLIIVIVIAVIVAAGVGVGGFFAGKAYEKSQANTVRNDFMRSRGIQDFNPNDLPAGANVQNGQARAFGGGAFGTVKSIDGNTLILTTAQNTEVKVTLSDTTQIEKTISGATSDLTAGLQVSVNGQRDASGNITAVQVTILPAGSIQAPTATPTP
jgi:hypothetical protein